jgi:hypothetical protein
MSRAYNRPKPGPRTALFTLPTMTVATILPNVHPTFGIGGVSAQQPTHGGMLDRKSGPSQLNSYRRS